MDTLIKNARVVDGGEVFAADVLLKDGKISRVARGESLPAEAGVAIVDAAGKYLIPGVIDEHVHFREPGLTHKADIATESRAAVAGGVTSFMDMPNTMPPTVTREVLQQKFSIASETSLANYSFYIGATNGNLGDILRADFSSVCGIKLFMGSSTGNMLVDDKEALQTLFTEAPALIAAHCEDEATIRESTARFKALADSGALAPSASLHPRIRTSEACLASSRLAAELADKAGPRLHILHVSSAAELELFRSDIPLAQKKITAETCPHYLCFDEGDYDAKGFAIKCNPAIKSRQDRAALAEALKTGAIDTIGSDHAPHLWSEKDTGDYFTAKSGFPSIQHNLQLMLDFVREGSFGIADVVRLMSHNPAVLYGIDRRGFVKEGYWADLAIVDLGSETLISNEAELSKCGWTPYDGRMVHSRVTHTFVNGNLVYENGVIHDDSRGSALEFNHKFSTFAVQ